MADDPFKKGIKDRRPPDKTDPNATDIDGRTALHWAVFKGLAEEVQDLLDAGANIDAAENDHYTALHIAALHGHTEIVKRLIKNGANTKARTKKGETPLVLAIRYGHTETLRVLADALNDINEPMAQTGWTALHHAAFYQRPEIIKTLTQKGARHDVSSPDGLLPLHVALRNKDKKTVDALLENGSLALLNTPHDITYPLHIACNDPYDINIIKSLLENGANPNQPDIITGQTPLQLAVYQNKIELAQLLIKYGADINKPATKYSAPPLHIAIEKMYLSSVPRLIELGVDLNTMDAEGHRPLDIAAGIGKPEICEKLLAAGAEPNRKDKKRVWTGLHAAVGGQKIQYIHDFLKYGMDVNAQSASGDTPLHIAAQRGNPLVIQILLKANAKTDIKNDKGETPMAVAVNNFRRDCITLLMPPERKTPPRNRFKP